MTDQLSPLDPNEEPDLGTSFTLTRDGWEATDFVEPGTDWRLTEDGAYESPDGTTRTWAPAEPTGDWTFATRPSER